MTLQDSMIPGGGTLARGEGDPLEPPVVDSAPPLLDLGIGLVAVLGGIALFLHAGSYGPMIPGTVIGPGLLLRICAVVFVLGGAAMLPAAVARRGAVPSKAGTGEHLREHAFALVPAALLLGVLLATPWIGFLAASGLATLLFVRAGGAGWIGSVVAAAVLWAAVWLAFGHLMRVPLPVGQWF